MNRKRLDQAPNRGVCVNGARYKLSCSNCSLSRQEEHDQGKRERQRQIDVALLIRGA